MFTYLLTHPLTHTNQCRASRQRTRIARLRQFFLPVCKAKWGSVGSCERRGRPLSSAVVLVLRLLVDLAACGDIYFSLIPFFDPPHGPHSNRREGRMPGGLWGCGGCLLGRSLARATDILLASSGAVLKRTVAVYTPPPFIYVCSLTRYASSVRLHAHSLDILSTAHSTRSTSAPNPSHQREADSSAWADIHSERMRAWLLAVPFAWVQHVVSRGDGRGHTLWLKDEN